MDTPTGLIAGKAPLLTSFLCKRKQLRERRDYIGLCIRSNDAPPEAALAAFNHLNDVLLGREARA